MRYKTISKLLLGIAPASMLPMALTSCSVYTDMIKDFKPSYDKLPSTTVITTYDEAANLFFEKAKTQKDFILQENYWAHNRAANQEDSGGVEGVPQLTYTSKFTTYLINFAYINVQPDTHKISYKITTDIQEDVNYKYKDGDEEWTSTGVNHYKVEYECKNLVFEVAKYEETVGGQKYDMWLVKPTIYNSETDRWKRVLIDDEEVNFNVRYIVEAYNKDGLQRYVYEATEAAVMDKTRSFEAELKYLIDFFCCFYSYYLSDCTYPPA